MQNEERKKIFNEVLKLSDLMGFLGFVKDECAQAVKDERIGSFYIRLTIGSVQIIINEAENQMDILSKIIGEKIESISF